VEPVGAFAFKKTAGSNVPLVVYVWLSSPYEKLPLPPPTAEHGVPAVQDPPAFWMVSVPMLLNPAELNPPQMQEETPTPPLVKLIQ
jgi:hypothetical protein